MLTDRTVATLTVTRRQSFPDGKVPGLFLRVTPKGTKTWVLRYFLFGERRRLKLGRYDRMTLAEARTAARAAQTQVDDGKDPVLERRKARADAAAASQRTIDGLCTAYIEKHAKPKKRTWRADQGLINNKILPAWKKLPVAAIARRDCRALVDAIGVKAPIVANRVASLLSRLFRFAVDEEIIDANPAIRLPKPGVEASARRKTAPAPKGYTPDEVRRLWANTEPMTLGQRALFRLGLLTGQRPTEVADMRRCEINGRWWTIPGERTKNGRDHRVYLSAAAMAELDAVPVLKGAKTDYVFQGLRGKRQGAGFNAIAFAGLTPRLRPRHGLRDTAATGMAELGYSVETISRVINHAYGPRTTATYNAYAYDREKQDALTKWGAKVRAIIEACGP